MKKVSYSLALLAAVSLITVAGFASSVPTPSEPLVQSTNPGCDALFMDAQRVANDAPDAYGGGLMCVIPVAKMNLLSGNSYGLFAVTAAYVDISTNDVTYKKDGLKLGRNCLYLFRHGFSTPQHADDLDYSIYNYPAGTACPAKTALSVHQRHRVKVGGSATSTADVPAVVRIDQDYPSKHIIIGLKCLPTEWCELTTTGNPNPNDHSGMPVNRRIKGWFDEQHLAIAGPAGLQPSPVYATIYPSDTLPDHINNNFNGFHRVAVIKFNTYDKATLDRYQHKWGLDGLPNGILPTDSVWLEMRLRSAATNDYSAHYVVRGFVGSPRVVAYHADGPWERNWLMSNGITTAITVPAVRWGWEPQDEMAWVRCVAGCCGVTNSEDNILEAPPKKKP